MAKVLLWNVGNLTLDRGIELPVAILSFIPLHHASYYRLLIWVLVQN